jgi:DNA-binding MarR family transcriptional regulator/N-acetylglutamate synthase-like GNAT family acetyltransferase
MHELIAELGELALASRLRRLAERLMLDVSRVYHEQGLDFEPRWFLIFFELARSGPLPVTELASRVGVTHPAVNQIAHEMTRHGLLRSTSDRRDGRRRLLGLSPAGLKLLPLLQAVWQEVREATAELLDEATPGLLGQLAQVELALDRRNMYQRVSERLKRGQLAEVEIIPYRPTLRKYFQSLNLEWLRRLFTVEPADQAVLDRPGSTIIAKGGAILFARVKGKVVGTCALLPATLGQMELLKLAVDPGWQGRQVGQRLVLAAIEKARSMGARELIARSSPRLEAANRLYHSLKFSYAGADSSGTYRRRTIVFKLDLGPRPKEKPNEQSK